MPAMEYSKINIEICKGSIRDINVVLEIEAYSWGSLNGENISADEEKFKYRLENGLVNIVYVNKCPVGTISFQNPNFVANDTLEKIYFESVQNGNLSWGELSKKYNLPKDWYEATSNGELITTHSPNAKNIFLVSVGVNPKFRGNKLVDKLIAYTINEGKLNGADFALAYGRLPNLSEEYLEVPNELQVNEYMKRKKIYSKLPFDYGQRIHVRNGAKSVCPIPNAMNGDTECHNWGFLALYKLAERSPMEVCQNFDLPPISKSSPG